ncbi:MAG: FHA domain-containing protein [Planctomycetes bacterium]|nr:FHA domain-containing protein [Planctomycetota bacterium]
MAEIDPILLKLDQLISLSRLKEIAFIVSTDLTQRISKMAAVLKQLKHGAYLLGAGPSTVGIIPLTVDEVVLGRSATILEKPQDTIIDYAVADTLYFVPREVSRTHAKVKRHIVDSDVEYMIIDLESTCGTFVNGTRVDPNSEGVELSHGDVLSLGPSEISTYIFYTVNETQCE